MTPASQIPFDPKKTYLAAPMNDDHHDRTAFRFKGRERQGDADLTQDEKGVWSAWPFTPEFQVDEDAIYGFNDNCQTRYLITEAPE